MINDNDYVIEDNTIFDKKSDKNYEYQKPAFPVPSDTKSHKSGLTKLQYAMIELMKAYPTDDLEYVEIKAKEILQNSEKVV